MAKKSTIVKETAVPAASPRAASSRAPRVKAAQHSSSKVVPDEAVATQAVASAAVSNESPQEVIEQLAYGYWEARGRQAGSPLEDWVRAEKEYRQRIAARL
ncbi:MAG: DUF2934 domain-containing protein [Acidobacteriota bacterium]|nr:DUF2934 domain-containing protein [Acidobacteriota bacterium]